MDPHYPALWQLMGAYLHQDWDLDHATADAVAHEFIDQDISHYASFRSELQALLDDSTDEQLEPLMAESGAYGVPSADGRDARQWLTELLRATPGSSIDGETRTS